MRGLVLAAALLAWLPSLSSADEITIRMAAIAPDGTAWARDLKAMARELESATDGGVHMRWFLGGIAGDEHATLARVRRGQLDGFAAASSCLELAPTMKVTRVVGLVQSRAEGTYLLNQLRSVIDAEFQKSGFVDLALSGLGNDVLLLRSPVRSMADARTLPLWVWSADEMVRVQMAGMGLHLLPAEVDKLAGLYDEGKIDGMFVIPTAALAFQWTARAKYFLDVRASYLPGCVVMTQHAFDQLSFDQQQALRTAANKFSKRFEESGQRDDALLKGSLLEHQGVKRLDADERFRDEFFTAALEARAKIPATLLSPHLLTRALGILGDFRGEHP